MLSKHQAIQKVIREIMHILPRDERLEPDPDDMKHIEMVFDAGVDWARSGSQSQHVCKFGQTKDASNCTKDPCCLDPVQAKMACEKDGK